MTLDTAVLPPIAPATCTPALTGTWQLDPDRCALEVNYTVLGLTVWRARLRPLELRIVLGETEPEVIEVSGTVAARPAYASLPGTRSLFLPRAGRRGLIRVDGDAATSGSNARSAALVRVGARHWPADFVVRFTPAGTDRVVVAASGVIGPRSNAPLPAGETCAELAAEFVRCA